MADRTVIVSIVDETWASPSGSILDLFLESFHVGQGTKPLLNHLLIVALDTKAFQYCNSIHPHCFYLTNPPQKYTSKKPLLIPHLKYKFLQELIELGYNFVSTDADVMWLRNPFLQINPSKELTIACDFNSALPSMSNKVDEGFFYMKSNAVTMEYFKYWDMARFLYPHYQNQSLCEATVSEDTILGIIELRVEYLDVARFGGFCQQVNNMEEICTMRSNCCENIENKVHDLKLLLDDWRNFTSPSPERTSLKGSFFTWRAPEKCKVITKKFLK
ncbi:hypothetical protein ACOSQ2_001997 [Xanthoceras sorbifolium]